MENVLNKIEALKNELSEARNARDAAMKRNAPQPTIDGLCSWVKQLKHDLQNAACSNK